MKIPPLNPASVSRSWSLLKLSERISNVPEGFTPLVKNRSMPWVNNSEVDSSNAGEEMMARAPRRGYLCEMIRRVSGAIRGSYGINCSSLSLFEGGPVGRRGSRSRRGIVATCPWSLMSAVRSSNPYRMKETTHRRDP
jgi:hypothetical protein